MLFDMLSSGKYKLAMIHLFKHLCVSSSLSELCCILCMYPAEVRLLVRYDFCFSHIGKKKKKKSMHFLLSCIHA